MCQNNSIKLDNYSDLEMNNLSSPEPDDENVSDIDIDEEYLNRNNNIRQNNDDKKRKLNNYNNNIDDNDINEVSSKSPIQSTNRNANVVIGGGDGGCGAGGCSTGSSINEPQNINMSNSSGYGEGFIETPIHPIGGNGGGLSPMSTFNEERMRRRLNFFFMNPIEKWQVRKRFPYKFVIQLIKLVVVTTQLCLYAHSRYNHVNYTWDNRVAFSHLFLRNWDATLEVESYPPATGPLALYVQNDFFETIDYAIAGYANLGVAIGPYSYPTEDNEMAPLHLCLYCYKEGIIFGFNESYIFNSEIVKKCIDLTGNVTTIGTKEYLENHDININFSALVKSKLDFSIKTINFKVAGPIAPPDCYQFDISIFFDNRDHDGQMLLSLDAEPIRLHCNGNIEYKIDSEIDSALRSILNAFVIIICCFSFALCTRAIYRAQLLRIQTVHFFRITYNTELSLEGKLEFVNFW